MFGKFLLVLLVAVSCTQGASYHDRQDIDAINDIIGDIIEKIQAAIAKLQDLITNLEDKLKELIDSIDIGKIVADIKDKIKKIIAQIGDAVPEHCMTAANQAIDSLVTEAADQVTGCARTASEKATEVISIAIALVTEATNMESDIKARYEKCVEDNKLNPSGLAKCLHEQIEQVAANIKNMMAQVETLVKDAKNLYSTVNTCVTTVKNNVDDKSKAIIDDFKKCVKLPEP